MGCGPIKQTLRNKLANSFLNLFKEGSNEYIFLSISKTTPWTSEPTPDSDIDSIKEDTDFWRECIAHKRIREANVSFVVPRYDWVSGIVWDPYRDDLDMFDDTSPAKFYVLVDNERVYKCIDNNFGAISTQKPIETTTSIFKTSDGYSWKYLYKITDNNTTFRTSDFIPVYFVDAVTSTNDPLQSQLDVQNAAVDGSIPFIEITLVGDAYQNAIPDNASNIVQSKVSDTIFTINSPNISRVDGTYVGYSIKITDASSVNFGEIREIIAYDGNDKEITIASAFTDSTSVVGMQFSIIPTVKIYGNGSGAIAESKIDANSLFLTSVDVVNGGSGYNFATVGIYPQPTIGTSGAGSTGGVSSTAKVVFAPKGGHGANAITELGARHVMIAIDLNQEEGGSLSAEHDFRKFGMILNPLIYGSNSIAGTEENIIHDYLVESTSPITEFDGFVSNGKMIIGSSTGHSGLFYEFTSTVGNPKSGILKIINPNHTFEKNESLIISDLNFLSAGTPTTVKIGTLKLEHLETQKDVYRQTVKLKLTDSTNSFTDTSFVEDTKVIGDSSGATGIVSAWYRTFTSGSYSTNEGYLEVIDTLGSFTVGDGIRNIDSDGVLSSLVGSVTVVSDPEIQPYSGELVYIQNIQVLERDADQQEEFKIIISL